MDISSMSISTAPSLAISVSGTEYLQRSKAAGVMPGTLKSPQFEKDAAAGKISATQALGRVSADTVKAIENALKLANPDATLKGYKDGLGWLSPEGTFFTLEA